MNTKNQISKIKINPGLKLFLVSVPFLILYFLFCYLPLEGWKYAFYDYRPGYKLENCEFVGLKHFTTMVANPVMRRETFRVLRNTLAMSFIGIATSFVPMMFAIFLSELPWKFFRKFVQTVTTIPNFISWVLVFSLASVMFSVDNGIVNNILKDLGVIDRGINFLASSNHVWLTMWLYSKWKNTGWGAVIYLSGLSSIDQELYEAAAIDGAGRFAKIRHITIPGLMPTFVTLLIMDIGNLLNTGFDMFYVFQNAFNKNYIEVLDLYVFNQGIGSGNISYSTAVGMLKSLVAMSLLFFANVVSGKVRDEKIF